MSPFNFTNCQSMTNYIGEELELFKYANNWKKYYAKYFKHFLIGDILEVGAGIGETTHLLCNENQNSWVCLEPDIKLSQEIITKRENGYIPSFVSKTEQERIQNVTDYFQEYKEQEFEISIKLDGESVTYYLHKNGYLDKKWSNF